VRKLMFLNIYCYAAFKSLIFFIRNCD